MNMFWVELMSFPSKLVMRHVSYTSPCKLMLHAQASWQLSAGRQQGIFTFTDLQNSYSGISFCESKSLFFCLMNLVTVFIDVTWHWSSVWSCNKKKNKFTILCIIIYWDMKVCECKCPCLPLCRPGCTGQHGPTFPHSHIFSILILKSSKMKNFHLPELFTRESTIVNWRDECGCLSRLHLSCLQMC